MNGAGEPGSAPSTRWTKRKAPREVSQDEAVWRLVAVAAAGVVGAGVFPALVLAGLLAAVWVWRRWHVAWLVVPAVVPIVGAWAAGVRVPVGDPVGAIEVVVGAPGDVDRWVDLWVSTMPGSLSVAAVVAAGVVAWQRVRAPSWRKSAGVDARAIRRRSKATAVMLAERLTDDDGNVLLGVDEDTGKAAGVPRAMVGRHTLVVGTTGSGKTTTATRVAMSVFDGDEGEEGGGLVVIDLKGDPATVDMWRQAADARGRRCVVWSLDADTVYDPLATGGVSELTRKVMALSEWTEPYYKDQAEQLLQLALAALIEAGERPTLARLHALMTPDGLASIHGRCAGIAAEDLAREATGMDKGRQSALQSLRTKLGLLVQAEYGPTLDPDLAPDADRVDVRAALDAGDVVVVSLDELSHGHIAARMATVVVTDVAAAAGARLRAGNPRPGMLWVDEFSAMAPGPLASLFARVRSAKIALLLSTQEVSDLDREDPTFRSAVATNVGTLIAHRVHDPDSAQWIAALIGTRGGWAETSQVEAVSRWGADGAAGGATGMGSVRAVEEFVVHPNDVKSLPDHHAYVARLDRTASQQRARRVHVVPLRDRVAPPSDVPDPEPAVVVVDVTPEPLPVDAVQTDSGARPADEDAPTHRDDANGATVAPRLPGAQW